MASGSSVRTRQFLRWQKALEVSDRILGRRHLPKMILPHIRFDGAPRERLARNLHNLPMSVHARIGNGRDDETDARSRSPIAAGKFMREKQGIVAAFGCQQAQGLLVSWPNRLDVRLKPTPKLESVKLSLAEHKPQQLFAGHR